MPTDENNILVYSSINNLNNNSINYTQRIRKPKIDTFEYIFKINNNVDQNRIINYISEMQLNLENTKETENINNENENMNENNEENEEEISSSSHHLFNKKNKRKKEDIIEFIKSNRQKYKDSQIKKKEEKENADMKKFMEIVKLQKNIEDNKKINQLNSASSKFRNTTINNNSYPERNEAYIGRRTYEEDSNMKISYESSMSSSLNQQDFYINCYEAQKIYTTQDNTNNILRTEPEMIEENNYSSSNNNNDIYGNYIPNNFNVSNSNKKKM